MRLVFKVLFVLLVFAGASFADAISPAALAKDGAVTRGRHLSEIGDIMRGGRGGFIDFGFYYLPMRSQTPLMSEYGEHKGFAFNHHLASFGAGSISKDNNLQMGALLWFDRSGWDGEDFFFFPQYNDFSLQRSVVTWGLTFNNIKKDFVIAAGMQHQNLEHAGKFYPHETDSLLYTWAHLRYSKLSAQANFYHADWRFMRFSLDLESRSIYGGKSSGLLTYLPNVSLGMYNTDSEGDVDSLRLTWEQNLYGQKLYGEVSYDLSDAGFHSAALKYYPDPSRMIGFEATCLRRHLYSGSDDLLWGAAVDLLFARVAYNAAYDYDNFFGAKGTFLVEIKFNLATLDGKLFNRGATRSAPMETGIIKQFEKAAKKGEMTPLNEKSGTTKTIEAKGIRYEKVGNTGSTEGGL